MGRGNCRGLLTLILVVGVFGSAAAQQPIIEEPPPPPPIPGYEQPPARQKHHMTDIEDSLVVLTGFGPKYKPASSHKSRMEHDVLSGLPEGTIIIHEEERVLGAEVVPHEAVEEIGSLGEEEEKEEKKEDEAKLTKTMREEITEMLTVSLKGKGNLKIYGFARGDAYYKTGRLFPSLEIPFYALPDDPAFGTGPLTGTGFPVIPGAVLDNDEDAFTMTARLSRVGFQFNGTKAEYLNDAELEALIEMDFYNTVDNVIASRAMPRIRHGYAKATWGNFSILFGQYWDIVSPLYPFINDDLLMWNAGNPGDRRPQLRANLNVDLGCDRTIILTGGISATDTVDRSDIDGNGYFDGEDAGIPGVQGRMAYKHPRWFACEQQEFIEVGVWGLFSQDEANVPIGVAAETEFTSWLVGVDWVIPIFPRISVRGEAWTGSNLDDYRGGIDQGVNAVLGTEIDAWGGWTELVVKPWDWYQLAIGTTLDDPDDADLAGLILGREANQTYYIGNRFLAGGGLTIAFDVEFWQTDYANFQSGQAERFKLWMMQSF